MDGRFDKSFQAGRRDQKKAQESLESNDDKTWEMNKKYYKGLAWALRLVLDAPAANAGND